MPTYEYACKDCGHNLEVVQKFTDAPLSECPKCAGSLRKVLHAPGIAFKGSGFYKNDSRGSTPSSSKTPEADGTSTGDAAKSSEKAAPEPKSTEPSSSTASPPAPKSDAKAPAAKSSDS